jgi:glycosyltransferase involved in cell wall biosynthesis
MAAEAKPAISIVIAARNVADYIEETLRAVTDQLHSDFEVVVVDDGSVDATPDVVLQMAARDRRCRLIKGPARGVSAARNAGLAEVRTPYVLFLDADDLLEPDALGRFVTVLQRGDGIAALGEVRRISESGRPLRSNDNRVLAPAHDTLTALLRKNLVVNGGALAIRTDSARACGGFDESLSHGEDWEFWCRLAELGDFAIVHGGPVLSYRQRATGANYLRKESVFARTVASIDKVAARPSLRRRYGRRLPLLLRARRIDVFWSGVRNEMQHGSTGRAMAIAAAGLMLYPDSVLRPRLALRLLRSLPG